MIWDLLLLVIIYLFHLFCSGWIYDWIDHRCGISPSEREAYINQYDAQASKGKNKLEIWCGETLPGSRELRKWGRAHASDPRLYDRCVWLDRLADLPVTILILRFFVSDREFLGLGPISTWWLAAIAAYDLILLLLGIRWRRSIKG